MSFEEIFYPWEAEFDLFKVCNISGFEFYPYIRRDFVNNLLSALSGEDRDYFRETGEADNKLQLFLKLWKKTEKTPLKDVDMLILNHPRRVKEGDVYVCPYTDFLTDSFPNSVSLERLYVDHKHFEPAYTKNLVYIDRIVAKSYVYRLLYKKFRPKAYAQITEKAGHILEKPLEELEKRLEIPINKKALYERITILCCFYRYRKKHYRRFLTELRPKMLVEVVGKSFEAKLFNELCKELDIPTVEIQHSILTENSKYPEGVREKQYADFCLTFSEYWKDFAKPPLQKEERFFVAGQYNFEKKLAQYGEAAGKADKAKKTVVFISGLVYGRDLSLLAIDFARKIAKMSNDCMNVVFKLHPIEYSSWREMYPELAASGLTVLDTNEKNIYELFAESYAQVGVKSTALYEGIGFGLQTYILKHPLATDIMGVYEKGFAKVVETADELYDYIDSGNAIDVHAASKYFWEPNAEENTVKILKKILNGEIRK